PESDEAKYKLGRLFDSEEEMGRYNDWVRRARAEVKQLAGYSPIPRNPLEASDHEAEILKWLEARNVSEPWIVAPGLAESRIPVEMLNELAGMLNPKALAQALSTVGYSIRAERMAETVVDSSERIFELISAIRGYSYMDQAPVQDINLAQSIENTLAM